MDIKREKLGLPVWLRGREKKGKKKEEPLKRCSAQGTGEGKEGKP